MRPPVYPPPLPAVTAADVPALEEQDVALRRQIAETLRSAASAIECGDDKTYDRLIAAYAAHDTTWRRHTPRLEEARRARLSPNETKRRSAR